MHAICDSMGQPLNLLATAGQVSDYIGARALLSSLPDVDWLLGGRGYDADWFREALKDKGIRPCIPGRKQRKKTVKYPSRDSPADCTAGPWTSAATNAATGSRLCSAGSRIGGGLQPAMTDAPTSSYLQSHAPQPSSIGYES